MKCQLLDSVFNFTEEKELQYYRKQYATTIHYQIFDLFKRKPWAITDNLMTVASGINIPTQSRPKGFDTHSPAYGYVLFAYQELVDKGYLEEYIHTLGVSKIHSAKVTPKGYSKPLFYGTQL